MTEDHEMLDWDQDADERLAPPKKTGLDQNDGDFSDGDDVEDTISLGEEEDGPVYYSQHQVTAPPGSYSSALHTEVLERTPSSQRQESLGANDSKDYRHNSMDVESRERSSSRNIRSSTNSPPRQRYSTRHSSPQRSQQNGIRMTHALPPKPAAASVLYLPPSHPSLVAAVGMASTSISPPNRTSMRDSKKVNGTSGKPESSPMPIDLPPEWEKRYSRREGATYYYNRETTETTWEPPVSNIPSTSGNGGSQKRRRRSVSPGNNHIIPPESNTHHSQNSRSKRPSSLSRRENSLDDGPRSATPDAGGLSYQDRHYRPDGDPPPISNKPQQPDRNEGMAVRNEPKSRYERSPGMSPPHRGRARSISPLPDSRRPRSQMKESDQYPFRGNVRSGRDRDAYTNQETTISRKPDTTPIEPDYPDRRWVRSPRLPSPDVSRGDRASRRPPHRPNDDDDFNMDVRSDNRNRQDLRRRESSRGPREREQPRPSERREKPSENPSYLSAPTGYRSPPRGRDRDTGRDYAPPEPTLQLAPAPEPRRDRERPRSDHPSSAGPPLPARPPRESYNGRTRHEAPSQFEQPRYREDRDSDRNRRDPLPGNGNTRPQDAYPEDSNRMAPERPRRMESGYGQPSVDESSLRNKREPLPPQTKTFYNSVVPGPERVSASLDPAIPKEPRHTQSDSNRNHEPRGPRSQQDRFQSNRPAPIPPPPIDTRMEVDERHNSRSSPEKTSPYDRSRHPGPSPRDAPEPTRPRADRPLPPRQGQSDFGRPTPSPISASLGPDRSQPIAPPQPGPRDREKPENFNNSRKESRPPSMYPERNPPVQPRREPRGRSDDNGRLPPMGPVSGTNNVPIGVRRPPATVLPPNPNNAPSGPPHAAPPPPFNPSARPPPSTLINPTKAFDLPVQKGHYDRPPHLAESQGPSRPDTNYERSRPDKPPQTAEIPRNPPLLSVPPEQPRRRPSRFSPVEHKQRVEVPRLSQDEWRGHANPPESSLPTPGNDLERQSMPPPIIRDLPPKPTSTASRFSDRVPIPNAEPNLPRTPQLPSNPSNTNETHTAAIHKDISPPLSASSTEQSSKLTQPKGSNKSGSDSRVDSEQPPALPLAISLPDSPPNLARRMSSERPPRLRKYPTTSPIISMPDNDFRSGNVGADQPPSLNNSVSEDLKDRLDRPTLLDRLQAAPSEPESHPSLRDRLVPSKRDRDELALEEGHSRSVSYDNDEGNDNKRARRRAGKGRRGGGIKR